MLKNHTLMRYVRERIAELQKKQKCSIFKLSNKSQISSSTLYSILNGKTKNISLETIHRICIGLALTEKEFFNTQSFNSLVKNKSGT